MDRIDRMYNELLSLFHYYKGILTDKELAHFVNEVNKEIQYREYEDNMDIQQLELFNGDKNGK